MACWSFTIYSLLLFLEGVPGYALDPGPEYVVFVGAFLVFGIWGLSYLVIRGDRLLEPRSSAEGGIPARSG